MSVYSIRGQYLSPGRCLCTVSKSHDHYQPIRGQRLVFYSMSVARFKDFQFLKSQKSSKNSDVFDG